MEIKISKDKNSADELSTLALRGEKYCFALRNRNRFCSFNVLVC